MCISIPDLFAQNIDYDLIFCLLFTNCYFTDKKFQDDDDDSGMGPSISTGRKSTIVSEVGYKL